MMSECEKPVSYLTKAHQFSLIYASSDALNVATIYDLSSPNMFSWTLARLIKKKAA